MLASRGMGAVRDELKKPKLIRRKDAMEPVKVYAKGGETKVNQAGNYTKPGMRKAG